MKLGEANIRINRLESRIVEIETLVEFGLKEDISQLLKELEIALSTRFKLLLRISKTMLSESFQGVPLEESKRVVESLETKHRLLSKVARRSDLDELNKKSVLMSLAEFSKTKKELELQLNINSWQVELLE